MNYYIINCMNELMLQMNLKTLHRIVFQMDSRLSFHFEKIESTNSCFKSLSLYNNLFISVFVVFTFFLKTFLYRLTGYDSKDLITDSYFNGKEYNILISLVILLTFNLTFPSKESRNHNSIFHRWSMGGHIFKLTMEVFKTYEYLYFFEKFKDLHFDLLAHIEADISLYPMKSLNTILSYLIMDFYFCNFSSTTAHAINMVFLKCERENNWNSIKSRSKLFALVFLFYYFIYFKRVPYTICRTYGFELFEGADQLFFYMIIFILFQLEKIMKHKMEKMKLT